jgi:hypothetical protein
MDTAVKDDTVIVDGFEITPARSLTLQKNIEMLLTVKEFIEADEAREDYGQLPSPTIRLHVGHLAYVAEAFALLPEEHTLRQLYLLEQIREAAKILEDYCEF